MYNALGYGKGDTILACFAIAVGVPACVSLSLPGYMHFILIEDMRFHRPFLLWKYGERIRSASKYAKRT